MTRRALLFAIATLPILIALGTAAPALEIKRAQTAQVKPNLIWFQDQALFDEWTRLKKNSDAAAVKSLEDDKLKSRDAWQFIYPLKVRVMRYNAATKQVDVEMTTPGRMQGSTWILDSDALGPATP